VLRLITFGGLGFEPGDGSAAPRLRPPRLALLAVLAAAGDRGLSRERLVSVFWPEVDESHARHSLRQSRYGLRNDLNRDVIRSARSTLVLDATEISSDVADFHAALAAGDRARAVALASGPFLDGFYLPGVPGFERWVEDERSRLAAATKAALISLAEEATRANQADAAVDWWRQLTLTDPVSGRFALGYLRALAGRGDRAEALAFARQHEAVVRRELEADPDVDIRRLEADLRTPTATPARRRLAEPQPLMVAPLEIGGVVSPASNGVHSVPASLNGGGRVTRSRRPALGAGGAIAALVLGVSASFGWLNRPDPAPVFAVGSIRDEGVPDSMRVGRMLTDLLATDLARVDGLLVLANTRLLELMRPGQDSPASYADAARRAGASDLFEGRLIADSDAALALEIRRVDLRSGIVRDVYRVRAIDRFGLVDSVTEAVARRFRLRSPRSSIAAATTTSATAYRLYEEGLRAYFQFDVKAAQRLMRAALDEDSTFAMAAYYEASLALGAGVLPDGRHVSDAQHTALRLAARAPERERLTITANILSQTMDPHALAIAESLTTRYPNDPRALITLGQAKSSRGDWLGATADIARAIALDSIAERPGDANCHLCTDLSSLGEMYLWWDSLPAAERTAKRLLRLRPDAGNPLYELSVIRARLGDSAAAYATFRRMSSTHPADYRHLKLRLGVTLEDYDQVEREARPMFSSSEVGEWSTGAWMYLIALRNQGRLREATLFHRTGSLPGFPSPAFEMSPDDFNKAILAFERGDARASAAVFAKRVRFDMSRWMPGVRARHAAWNGALEGMALAGAGDTVAVRRLADSVEAWGRGSSYGRDRTAHHYLRGLVLARAGRHDTAAIEFRAALHSPTLGFTRVNLELARCLLSLGRAAEAVAVLQPALRGDVDASNLYVTRTELHELLAQAFDRAGRPDSAAAHYRAVVKAWQRADPQFHDRRARAMAWLASH
jgi:DNA-binding SARP family transcriptional activator/tetratricopeptide (TPR) repeat protein